MNVKTEMEEKDKLILALGILIMLFIGFLYYLGNRSPHVINYPNSRTEIIVFGDSLIAGVGSTDKDGFVRKLESLLNRDITNLGVSGNTTRDGLLRVDEVIEREAQLVIIALGGNDFIQRVPQDSVKRNFDKMISQIQNSGAMVMILGEPGYRGLYKDLSEAHDTAYVSNILSGLITKDKYMSDAIHPNDAGYRIIAERIAPNVKKLLRSELGLVQ